MAVFVISRIGVLLMQRQAMCCKPRSDSGISGTLFQRIKSQMWVQPYHVYPYLKQGGKSDVAWRRKLGVCNKQKRKGVATEKILSKYKALLKNT
jgi:hypothetical protein